MDTLRKGRAQYEDVSDKELFEDVDDPAELWPWMVKYHGIDEDTSPGYSGDPGFAVGWMRAPRGGGKSLLALKIAEEHPVKVYSFDREGLDIVVDEEYDPEHPVAVMFDEPHYMMQAKRLAHMIHAPSLDRETRGQLYDVVEEAGHSRLLEEDVLNPVLTDAWILDRVEEVWKEAKQHDARLVFAADTSPGQLTRSFTRVDAQRSFLTLCRNCLSTAADGQAVQELFDSSTAQDMLTSINYNTDVMPQPNVFSFRDVLQDDVLQAIREQYNVDDIPLAVSGTPTVRAGTDEIRELIQYPPYARVKQGEETLFRGDGQGSPLGSLPSRYHITQDDLVAPIRSIAVTGEEKGAVSRDTLGIPDIGIETGEDEVLYELHNPYTKENVDVQVLQEAVADTRYEIRGRRTYQQLAHHLGAVDMDGTQATILAHALNDM